MFGASRRPRNYYRGAFLWHRVLPNLPPAAAARSEAASKGAKASNQNSEAQSKRAKGNTNASKRSGMGGEKSPAKQSGE